MLSWFEQNRYKLLGAFLGGTVWGLIGFALIGFALMLIGAVLGRALDRSRAD